MKDLLRKLPTGVDSYVKFGEREKQLLWKLQDSKSSVHEALCGTYTSPLPHSRWHRTLDTSHAHTHTFSQIL